MPGLSESLQGKDLGFLKVVALLWDLEFSAPDTRVGMQRLMPMLLQEEHFMGVLESLPPQAYAALADLQQNDGRMPWALFTRKHGLVREMGPGKRDRERPYASSASPAESLWYRALVGRGFFELVDGPEEMAYIPDDLLAVFPVLGGEIPTFGRSASPAEKAFVLPANDRIVDHACTLLAGLRIGLAGKELTGLWAGEPEPAVLLRLLETAGLVDAIGQPMLEPARAFLESSRGEALAFLAHAWLNSHEFNELHLLPNLQAEGEWQNDPYKTRQAVIGFLPPAKEAHPLSTAGLKGSFWSLGALIQSVYQAEPDFQRPAGDYDSWYLRDLQTGDFVRGFENWERVDGALIRFIISGPLHWLGFVDLASPSEGAEPAAFGFTKWAGDLFKNTAPEGLPLENGQVIVRSDARIWVPRAVPRSLRYQVARFCSWLDEKEDGYVYQVTPESLERARQAGLRASHLLGLLRRQAETVPPAFSRALERWEERGTEVRFQRMMVLRLGNPELLQALRNSKAGRFLGDPLGPTAVEVQAQAWTKVVSVLAEMGYLCQEPPEEFN
jgi:hypothetical protein